MNTRRNLPTREQMADWISQITPDDDFEKYVSFPGMLFMRVKSPRSEYQGVHFGLSRMARNMIEEKLEEMQARHDRNSFTARGSLPAGKSWLELLSSRLHVKCLTSITISLVTDLDVLGEVEWDNNHMILRFSDAGRKVFLQALRERNSFPKLAIRRSVKPDSSPQSCWIWQWESNI